MAALAEGKTCWVLTVGVPGMDNQSLGLARQLPARVVPKRIVPVAPWKHLPPQLWWRPLQNLGPGSDALEPPWPDILIGTARPTVAVMAALKRASGGRIFTVHIHDPHAFYGDFDLIVTPRHDRLRGPRVVHSQGGFHLIDAAALEAARARFAPRWADLPRPLVGVLLGGNNRCYRMDEACGGALGAQLAAMCRSTGGALLVTPSRRTPPDALRALCAALGDTPAAVWDGASENPYMGILACADAFVVTADSVNMVTEACYTGRPVMVADLPGGDRKFRAFHAGMQASGCTRPFRAALETWSYPPLDEMATIAVEVMRRIGQ